MGLKVLKTLWIKVVARCLKKAQPLWWCIDTITSSLFSILMQLLEWPSLERGIEENAYTWEKNLRSGGSLMEKPHSFGSSQCLLLSMEMRLLHKLKRMWGITYRYIRKQGCYLQLNKETRLTISERVNIQ